VTILATFHPYVDGRTIASAVRVFVVPSAGNYAITITIPEHRITERVLEWNLRTNPLTDPGTPTNVVITRNTVGCTLVGVGHGTTLTAEAVTSGF